MLCLLGSSKGPVPETPIPRMAGSMATAVTTSTHKGAQVRKLIGVVLLGATVFTGCKAYQHPPVPKKTCCIVVQKADGTWHAIPGYGGTTTIQEDEPGWDCKTMGNKICGPK